MEDLGTKLFIRQSLENIDSGEEEAIDLLKQAYDNHTFDDTILRDAFVELYNDNEIQTFADGTLHNTAKKWIFDKIIPLLETEDLLSIMNDFNGIAHENFICANQINLDVAKNAIQCSPDDELNINLVARYNPDYLTDYLTRLDMFYLLQTAHKYIADPTAYSHIADPIYHKILHMLTNRLDEITDSDSLELLIFANEFFIQTDRIKERIIELLSTHNRYYFLSIIYQKYLVHRGRFRLAKTNILAEIYESVYGISIFDTDNDPISFLVCFAKRSGGYATQSLPIPVNSQKNIFLLMIVHSASFLHNCSVNNEHNKNYASIPAKIAATTDGVNYLNVADLSDRADKLQAVIAEIKQLMSQTIA